MLSIKSGNNFLEIDSLRIKFFLKKKNICSIFNKFCSDFELTDITISIKLFNEEKIKKLNYQFAGNDYPTDVLTFPNTINGKISSDIAICWNIINKNSKKYKNSLQTELWYILTHALIHSLDYDHQDKAQQKEFISLQNRLLKIIGLKIDLDFFKRDITIN